MLSISLEWLQIFAIDPGYFLNDSTEKTNMNIGEQEIRFRRNDSVQERDNKDLERLKEINELYQENRKLRIETRKVKRRESKFKKSKFW